MLKLFDKKGGKVKTEVHSQHISAMEVLQSKGISDEHQSYFKISLSTKEPPVCLYAKRFEELSKWIASLLVVVSKGMLYV